MELLWTSVAGVAIAFVSHAVYQYRRGYNRGRAESPVSAYSNVAPIAIIEHMGTRVFGAGEDLVDSWRIKLRDTTAAPLDYFAEHVFGVGHRKGNKAATNFRLSGRDSCGFWGMSIDFCDPISVLEPRIPGENGPEPVHPRDGADAAPA